ncbi:unnamed protein product [Sphagnum balticum]
MLGDTQLVSCSRGSGSGSGAKSEDCILTVAKQRQRRVGHVLVKLHASSEGEEDVVELGVDGHPLLHPLAKMRVKVSPGGNVDLAMKMVVHKDAARLGEAQKG